MRVIISCQHIELTDGLREHTEAKVRKACSHLAELPANCQVHLNFDSNQHRAELLLHHQGHDFAARSDHASDMYTAIDAAGARLRRQLDEFCNKQNSHK